jgi:hypothetical protein
MQREQLRVQVVQNFDPYKHCPDPPFITQGVTTVAKQSLQVDWIANSAIIPNSAGLGQMH